MLFTVLQTFLHQIALTLVYNFILNFIYIFYLIKNHLNFLKFLKTLFFDSSSTSVSCLLMCPHVSFLFFIYSPSSLTYVFCVYTFPFVCVCCLRLSSDVFCFLFISVPLSAQFLLVHFSSVNIQSSAVIQLTATFITNRLFCWI